MSNKKAYMAVFNCSLNNYLNYVGKEWVDTNPILRYDEIIGISVSDDFDTFWVVIEADSESQLLKVIDGFDLLPAYDFTYHALMSSTLVVNFREK